MLDVGCASGKTACYLADCYGCSVVGVDLLPEMVAGARERANREDVVDKVSFQVAHAQNLPFEDSSFDIVIGEFITGLLEDKSRGIREYLRVTKPGGCIGLNEATWIKTPPPKGLAEYLSNTFGVRGGLMTGEEWEELLVGVWMKDILVRTHKISNLSSWREGVGDLLRVGHKVVYQYIRDLTFRKFMKETMSLPKDLFEHFGCGLYVGSR